MKVVITAILAGAAAAQDCPPYTTKVAKLAGGFKCLDRSETRDLFESVCNENA